MPIAFSSLSQARRSSKGRLGECCWRRSFAPLRGKDEISPLRAPERTPAPPGRTPDTSNLRPSSNLLQRSGRDGERIWCAAQVAQAVVKRTPWTWAITAARAWHSLDDPLQVVCCLEVKRPK